MIAEILLGLSLQTPSENGTWYDKQFPYSFSKYSTNYGTGIKGSNWALTYENLGVEHAFAYVCPSNCTAKSQQYHWNTRQQPRGIWATYEPHYDNAFGQVGIGVFKPYFTFTNTDLGWSGGNNNTSYSYLLGVGYKTKNTDIILNARYVGPLTVTQEAPAALGKFAFTLSFRKSF